MPSATTHALLAKEIQRHYENKGQPISCEPAFLCGAQGPDFLLIHRGFPWQRGQSLKEVGRKIHWSRPSVFFEALRRWLCIHKGCDAALSYALGFLTHYAFDSIAHPYVYSQIEEWTKQNPAIGKREAHARIETALDVIMLRYLHGITPLDFPLKQIYPKLKEGEPEVATMLSCAIREAFGETATESQLIQAMNDFRLSQKLLSDPTLLKKPLMERLERRFRIKFPVSSYIRPLTEEDEDFANVQHDIWYNPFAESPAPRTDDFFSLYHDARTRSTTLIDQFRRALHDPAVNLHDLTGELSYETGIPVRPDDYKL